jgi:hypothetical protein
MELPVIVSLFAGLALVLGEMGHAQRAPGQRLRVVFNLEEWPQPLPESFSHHAHLVSAQTGRL